MSQSQMRESFLLTIIPACSILRANSAFSDKNPYPSQKISPRMTTPPRNTAPTRMNHVDIVSQSDFDDLVDLEIGLDRCEFSPCSNLIGFIRLFISRG